MSKNFAVLISGCGVYDGAEIGEVMMTLLAISASNNQYTIFAPDKEQMHVVNHYTGEATSETRNVLVEAARIARGKVTPITEYKAEDFDGLMMPGGFGAAKNLSTFATQGAVMEVLPEVEKAVLTTHQIGKPVVALCISPVIIAKLIPGAEVTIGIDEGTAQAIETMGGKHIRVESPAQFHHDAMRNIYTAPCYMLGEVELKDVYAACQGILNKICD